MTFNAPYKKNEDFPISPQGPQPAICYSVIYIGTIPSSYLGETKMRQTVRITFELHGEEKMQDGRPFAISREFTFSSSAKSSLRKFIEQWRGKTFTDEELEKSDGIPMDKLVGQPAYLSVIHTVSESGKKYANISSVMPMPKGLPVPKMINPPVIYNVNFHDDEVFKKIPTFLQDKIKSSEEWKKEHEPVDSYDDLNDEVPF